MNPLSASQPVEPETSRPSEEFTATHWTQVLLAARQDGSAASSRALEELCARYWPAVYGFLRRQGHAPADAEDLTQGFFSHLFADHALARADRSKGRFRSFLLGALQRFLADEFRRSAAQKRDRKKLVLALDFAAAERTYLEEMDPGLTPEETYDRRWAATVLEAAFADLEAEFRDKDQSARLAELKRFLAEEGSDADYAAVATRLGLSPKAVSSAVCRLRDRYRELVRRTVLTSLGNPEEVDAEFRQLFR